MDIHLDNLSASVRLVNQTFDGKECSSSLRGPYFILVAYVCSFIGLFGIPANALTVCVLRADRKKNTARYLMLVLAAQDLSLIIIYMIYYIVPLLHQRFEAFPFIIQYIWFADSPILFLLGWFKFSEAYTIVLISIDRFVALRYPFKSASICTLSNARRAQVLIWVVGLASKLPNLILDFCYHDWYSQCDSCEPIFIKQPWYGTFRLVYVQIIDQIITFLIPLACLVLLNGYLIWQLRGVDKLYAAENRCTMLVCVITMFIICETPTALYFFLEMYAKIRGVETIRETTLAVYAIALFTAMINFACNFVIYGLVGCRFRWILKQSVNRPDSVRKNGYTPFDFGPIRK
ncbi:unnamed protein product [Dibothriocephalus latus]|uniref:G-protein coupled receptors family 1 profile domain-containing protein n=1 Tax=Dibothriocephalus latus TaxID=60516 RepID=A0A3P6UHT9_DIBLA|nr:unnamed protein product [Dibothriocephalus latus]